MTPIQSRALTIGVIAIFQGLGGVALGPLAVGMLNDALAPSVGALALRYSLTVALLGFVGVAVLALVGLRYIKADFARAQAERSVPKAANEARGSELIAPPRKDAWI